MTRPSFPCVMIRHGEAINSCTIVTNSGLPQQTADMGSHTHIRKRAASPNPTTPHSRVRTNSKSDSPPPAGSALTRPPNRLLEGRLSRSTPLIGAPLYAASRRARTKLNGNATNRHATRCRHLLNQDLLMDTLTTSFFVCHHAALVHALPYHPLLYMARAAM